MSLTLVTGGSGFVGSHVVRRLLAENGRVRLLVREPGAVPTAVVGRVEVVIGDIRDRSAIRRAVAGAGAVLHLAALARPRAGRGETFAEVNGEAVCTLLQECARAGVGRVVHVSTWLVAPPDRPARVRGAAALPTPYESSKRDSEAAVAAHVAAGHDAVVVRPTRIYGPGPLHEANGATMLLDLYLSGRLRLRLADGGAVANWVHVDDVAAGILLAARRGRRGAAYVLGGPQNVGVREYLELAARVAGRRPRRLLPLPPAAAIAFAQASPLLAFLTGIPPITPSWVRTLLESRTADITDARRDLGYAPRDLRDGLAETVAWLGGRRSW